jgi:hypothetical protein
MKPWFLGLLISIRAGAMDPFAALSMIESGDNDFARGKAGEVSRYQIRRDVWARSTAAPISQATDPQVAGSVARSIAWVRCHEFEISHGRPATALEFYILWNAPEKMTHPSRVILARARRFSSLVASAK